MAKGFAHAHCASCHKDFLIAFSYKGRVIYPSCNTRAMVETAAHLIENIGSFLESLAAWVEDMDAFYRNKGIEIPEKPDWQMVADMLAAAKYSNGKECLAISVWPDILIFAAIKTNASEVRKCQNVRPDT